MSAAPVILLRESREPEDFEELTNVWRDSVEATHHFLSLEAIDRLEPRIRDEYLPRLRIQVAERNGSILGFIGMKNRQVSMLFVADEVRSTGVGSKLLEWAQQQFPRLVLDVNEQNPRAAVFYIKRGFTPVGRSETDAHGLPHPLLHMSWDGAAR
ncbi:GNAT family N-acetyltransferase [Arthrobacter sp. LAPM80]|uniref:GNAT family N-acetyltransferase n=1 Tax=Arthrobacter sp. LAPM80 TaxID=3141788 RepID=UPI00398B072E